MDPAPAPRPVRHPDGTSEAELAATSPFPRHYLYDAAGRLSHESAVIRFDDWIRRSGLEASGSAYLSEHVTVRARTPSRFAVRPLDRLGEQALAQLIGERFSRLDRMTP